MGGPVYFYGGLIVVAPKDGEGKTAINTGELLGRIEWLGHKRHGESLGRGERRLVHGRLDDVVRWVHPIIFHRIHQGFEDFGLQPGERGCQCL